MPDETPFVSVNRELTTEIVAAYVRRNQVASDQLGILISTVHQALAGLRKPATEAEGERTPSVPIRRSVHCDYVLGMRLARPDGETTSGDRPWIDH